MEKKYIVRLTDEERGTLRDVIKRLKGSSPGPAHQNLDTRVVF